MKMFDELSKATPTEVELTPEVANATLLASFNRTRSRRTLLKSAVAGALVVRRRKDRLLMKHARLSRFLTVALALVSLVTISWVVPPLTVAHAQAASPSALPLFSQRLRCISRQIFESRSQFIVKEVLTDR